MTSKPNIIDFTRTRRSADSQPSVVLPQLVISAQRTAKHHLRQLLPDFFTRIDDNLFELADKAESNQQQTLYFDAMRETRRQKEVMQKSYFEALSQGFEEALVQTSPSRNNSAGLDQMGLMDDEQLEESLAISNMVSSAENRTKEELFGLTARLNYLIEDIEITKDNNPLQPKVLFEAFMPAVQTMDADIKVRLIIYKLFDKLVAQQIGAVYKTINADLVAAGVLPRIKSDIRKSENNSSRDDKKPANVAPNTSPEAPQQPGNMFDSLQQLLSMARVTPAMGTTESISNGGEFSTGSTNLAHEAGINSSAANNNVIAYAPQEVITALSQLQITDSSPLQQFGS